MAEGTFECQDSVGCRYFLSATCRDGEKCLFSHNSSSRIPDSVCRYYLRGTCTFGEHCWYDHVPVNVINSSKNNSNSKNLSADASKRSANHNLVCDFTTRDISQRNVDQPRFFHPISNSGNRSSNAEVVDFALKTKFTSSPTNWINAPEFVPCNSRSYADTVKVNITPNNNNLSNLQFYKETCPLFAEGDCHLSDCPWIHGHMCDLCQKACLHPFDEEARKSHIEACEKKFEQDMEFSFAMQRSMEKTCGICMEVVLEKKPGSERKFGILEKCNHVYCLSCIRKWRSSRRREDNHNIELSLDLVTRACPECRIVSHFIIPSDYIVDTEEEKQKLITEYKNALSRMHCKYFKKGEGICPFGRACFYLHANPDGTKVDVPYPTRRRRQDQDSMLDFIMQNSLWDYIEERAERDLDFLDHIDEFSSDSDDSVDTLIDAMILF